MNCRPALLLPAERGLFRSRRAAGKPGRKLRRAQCSGRGTDGACSVNDAGEQAGAADERTRGAINGRRRDQATTEERSERDGERAGTAGGWGKSAGTASEARERPGKYGGRSRGGAGDSPALPSERRSGSAKKRGAVCRLRQVAPCLRHEGMGGRNGAAVAARQRVR